MLINIALLVTLTGTLITTVCGLPVGETNARRMARGLPPNPPSQFARRSPTVPWFAKRNGVSPSPSPSPRPSKCFAGKIQVKDESDDHTIGFVRNWENGGISGINFSGGPLEVKVCKSGANTDRYDIIATNAVFKTPFNVGASSGTVAKSLTTGDRSSVAFSNVPQTAPNAPPTSVDGNFSESAIWSFNPSTKELSPQWINPDGTKPNTVIAYDVRANELFFVGDISQWDVSGFFASAVNFYLV